MPRSMLFPAALLACSPAFAGFPATEVFLPAVGRVAGAGSPPAQFYTTVWATNLTNANETFTFEFLKQGQANTSPVKFSDTLSPGQTKVYENIVEDKLGLSSAIGAARVTSSGEIMLSERIYNQLPGDDVGNSEGLFFAGVPKSFSITLGQSATIQGVSQGGSEDFRYNFALVETGGGTPTVHVALLDDKGATLGSHDYILEPYEQLQPNVTNLFSSVSTINARVTATVTAGTGSVLIAGAQVANESQDSSGFEMSFRGDLLGSGGTAGVTSLNGLTGDVTIKAGTNVTLNKSGQTITINSSGGGLTLPYKGSFHSDGVAFYVESTGVGYAVVGSWNNEENVGSLGGPLTGVYGTSQTEVGVEGFSHGSYGVMGVSDGPVAVLGHGQGGVGSRGVEGMINNGVGVYGHADSRGHGVWGKSFGDGPGNAAIYADGDGIGLYATNNGADATIVATNGTAAGDIFKGFNSGGANTVIRMTGNGDVIVHGGFFPGGLDYADRLPADEGLEPGDVVVIGPEGILQRACRPNDGAVAGVYSTRPGVEGHRDAEPRTTVPVALSGLVPVKVTDEGGPIRPGDLLVSSSTPGNAMRAPEAPMPGTVIGKAMQSFPGGRGVIEMLVWAH
jgi:hypothetical protein